MGRCLIRHRSPQERGSPVNRISSIIIASHSILFVSLLLPSSIPPTLTTAGVTFFLKLPVRVGRSGGCLQNAMVRMTLATMDCKKQCEDSHFSGTGCKVHMYTGYSTYHLPQLQVPQQRSPQQQYSTHPHHETA